MKYVKASDVLPSHLLEEIQRYMGSGMLYIPRSPDTRKPWGENSGAREELRNRNERMKADFHDGFTIAELADTYCLSIETVKKIVYS